MTEVMITQVIIALSLLILARVGLEAAWILPLGAASFIDGKAQLISMVLIDTAFFISMLRGRQAEKVSKGLLWQSLGTLALLGATVLPAPPEARLWLALGFVAIRVMGGPHSLESGVSPETRFHFFSPLMLLTLLSIAIPAEQRPFVGGACLTLAFLCAFSRAPIKGLILALLGVHIGLEGLTALTPLLAAGLVGGPLLLTVASYSLVCIGLSALKFEDPLFLWGIAASLSLVGIVLRAQLPLPQKSDIKVKSKYPELLQAAVVLAIVVYWLSRTDLQALVSNQVIFLALVVIAGEFAIRRFLKGSLGFELQPYVQRALSGIQSRIGKEAGTILAGKIHPVGESKTRAITRPGWLEPELANMVLAAIIIWGLWIWLQH